MRTVTMRIYSFDELSPKARKNALAVARTCQQPVVQEMVEALFQQELAKVGGVLNSFEIDFESMRISAHIAPAANTEEIEAALNSAHETANEELPDFLSDKWLIANIEADDLEFLADGQLWVYGGGAKHD
jgi:hypothetical protein